MSVVCDAMSTHPFVTSVVLLVVCWLLVRYIVTGRKRRVSDYAKKFDPVDVSMRERTLKLSKQQRHSLIYWLQYCTFY